MSAPTGEIRHQAACLPAVCQHPPGTAHTHTPAFHFLCTYIVISAPLCHIYISSAHRKLRRRQVKKKPFIISYYYGRLLSQRNWPWVRACAHKLFFMCTGGSSCSAIQTGLNLLQKTMQKRSGQEIVRTQVFESLSRNFLSGKVCMFAAALLSGIRSSRPALTLIRCYVLFPMNAYTHTRIDSYDNAQRNNRHKQRT